MSFRGTAATSGLDMGLQASAAGGAGQLADSSDRHVFGNGMTELLDWNFDDWMFYSDVPWQQNLAGTDTV